MFQRVSFDASIISILRRMDGDLHCGMRTQPTAGGAVLAYEQFRMLSSSAFHCLKLVCS